MANNSIKSWNWPWISPQMMTGAFTSTMLLSSYKTSDTLEQRNFKSERERIRHSLRVYMRALNSALWVLGFILIIMRFEMDSDDLMGGLIDLDIRIDNQSH